MLKVYKHSELGHANHGWLNAYHHFSFANYYNPERMGFGVLRVINDDTIKAGTGFPQHGHKDMEIITFVRKGAITHKDSKGNEGRTVAGDVQVMSAGTGILHSEFNREDEDTQIFQIWIVPKEQGIEPRWASAEFAERESGDTLPLLASGFKEDQDSEALYIHQDAAIYGGKVNQGQTIEQPIKQQAYMVVSSGAVTVEGVELTEGDGLEITDRGAVNITGSDDSVVILIDVPA
jgi:redox-sensitive bicupin YhaK (pirin superfamily)